jgi:outer membrane protein assembly factor BamB
MSRLTLACLGLFVLTISAAPAPEPGSAEWPCFRGAKHDAISPDKGLLKKWPTEGPKLLWKATGAGQGFSSVAVTGGKVFTMGTEGRKTYMTAFDRAKGGKPLWTVEVGAGGDEPNGRGTRSTPTYSDGLVYGIGSAGDLVCVAADKGEVKWRKNLKSDFGGSSAYWRYSESPLVDGENVIVTPGGSKALMVCLNKKTGKEVWRTAGGKQASGSAGYSSIVISNAGGVKQYVTLVSSGTIGVDANNGKLLWYYDRFRGNTANIPTCIVLGEQLLTVAGYGKSAALITLKKDGDEFKVKEEWSENKLRNKHGGVLIVGDLMFGDTDDSGMPYCAKWKSGDRVWQRERRVGKGGGSAAITYADGNLYVRYQNGWMALVPVGGDKYEEKGSFKIPGVSGPSWAHPVVIGGKLYLREGNAVLCYDVKSSGK